MKEYIVTFVDDTDVADIDRFENKKNNTKIAIMHVPKRKNKALCVFEAPNEWVVVATFANNRQAFIFEKYLERFLGEAE